MTVETVDGEELAVAVPDENDHATFDFSMIWPEATTLVLKAFDADGNEQTKTTVEYLPGEPAAVTGPPEPKTPEIPFQQNNRLHQLQGGYFDAGTEVVITDAQGEAVMQETLSTSTNQIKYYLDSEVGPQEARVFNEFGSSQPIGLGVYNFDVAAGKTALSKHETTTVNASYDGLVPGTRIVFTNVSENVTITPKGKAKVDGNEIAFTVKRSAGEVAMKVKARQEGDWGLDYRIEFPASN